MEIKVCTTKEWSDIEWSTYVESFNKVFLKDFDINYFKHKYLTSEGGFSYHALLLDEGQNVVGGCSVSPFKYKKGEEIIKIGQSVDVFIIEQFRTDPFTLRRMYLQLKKLLIINNIKAVMAVPNTTAYQYWKSIVKWKDVGELSYWILPIRVGNIIKKWSFLNYLSLMFIDIWLCFNAIMMLIANNEEKFSLYELIIDDNFCRNRYSEGYMKVVVKDIVFYYKIYEEEGVKTGYLIDARQNERLTFKALFKGVSYIVKNTNVDLVMYVGPVKLFQTLLVKIPKKIEPKRLPLTCDILNMEDINIYSDMLDIKNWNFGLINYDVR